MKSLLTNVRAIHTVKKNWLRAWKIVYFLYAKEILKLVSCVNFGSSELTRRGKMGKGDLLIKVLLGPCPLE